MQEVQWERYKEAQYERDGNPLIALADAEQVSCDRPRDCERIELLNVLPAPDVGAFNGDEDWGLVLDDAGVVALAGVGEWESEWW